MKTTTGFAVAIATVLTFGEWGATADRQTTPHKIEILEPVKLWSGGAVPKTAALPMLPDVRFSVIKPYEFQKDGYRFLHGVALAWHQGRLYASFGHNQGGENTDRGVSARAANSGTTTAPNSP